MQKMRGSMTYDVYLRIESLQSSNQPDARQLLIGKLPIAFGGRFA